MTEEYVRHHVYVDVLDDSIWVAEDYEGELYFPLRPSCAALEIDSTTALETIKADSRLASGLRRIKLPTAGGEQIQQCLRSDEYTWWLAIIDPRRFKSERRQLLTERQRVLMRLAKEIMLKRQDLRPLPKSRAPKTAQAIVGGYLEAPFRCLNCNAPHVMRLDGQGWHLHLGVEV